jgi:hypothetical protein
MFPHKRHPGDLGGDLRYFRDPPVGDGRRFHLYLYYRDKTRVPPEPTSFHAEWVIPGTDWDPATERGEAAALEADHRARQEQHLITSIERELQRTNTILVKRGSELVRITSPSNDADG